MENLNHWFRRFHLAHFILLAYWLSLFASTHLRIPTSARHVVQHSDKLLHLGAFSGLAFLVAWAFQSKLILPARYLALFALLSIYAILDEWSQMFFPYRTVDAWDAMANVCGAAIGLCFYFAVTASLRMGRVVSDP